MTKIEAGTGSERRAEGFSLIEVLIALVLMALVLSLLPNSLRLARRALTLADGLDRASSDVAVLDFVERQLSEAMPIYRHAADGLLRVAFAGEARSVSFVAPMRANATENGLFQFTLAPVDKEDDSKGVMLTWQSFRANPDTRDAVAPVGQRMIMADSHGFGLRYLGGAVSGRAPEWSDNWQPRDVLPAVVEITYATGSTGAMVRKRRIELQLTSRQ